MFLCSASVLASTYLQVWRLDLSLYYVVPSSFFERFGVPLPAFAAGLGAGEILGPPLPRSVPPSALTVEQRSHGGYIHLFLFCRLCRCSIALLVHLGPSAPPIAPAFLSTSRRLLSRRCLICNCLLSGRSGCSSLEYVARWKFPTTVEEGTLLDLVNRHGGTPAGPALATKGPARPAS